MNDPFSAVVENFRFTAKIPGSDLGNTSERLAMIHDFLKKIIQFYDTKK